MTRYIVRQPWGDDVDDLSNATAELFVSTPQSICGLAPGSYRVGFLDWSDEEIVIPTVNLLLNTVFAGAVSGTPGTGPTAWTRGTPDGTLTVSGATMGIAATAARETFVKTVNVAANTSYYFSILTNNLANASLQQRIGIINRPAGSSVVYEMDGEAATGGTTTGVAERTIAMRLDVGDTAGSADFIFGVGVASSTTGNTIFFAPQVNVGAERIAYQAITATS